MNATLPRLSGLTAKQAKVTVAVVLVLSMAGSLLELFLDWHSMRDQVQRQVAQILGTVDGSAVEAAYQLNQDLATKVVDGLLGYDIIESANLLDNFGDLLAESARRGEHAAHGSLADILFGDVANYSRPLVRPDATVVGKLEIHLSRRAVASSFYGRAVVNAGMGLLRSLGIVVLVVGIFYAMITRPLVRLAQEVAQVDPDRPGNFLMPAPPGHGRDELGQLVSTLNALLSSSQRGLDQRDQAQAELTALTHDLERRVAERTRALEAASDEIRSLNAILKAENVRMGAELDVSRRIQQMVLPTHKELAHITDLDMATHMEPASEVGGDYFDILHGPGGRVRIGIGDVTGHGLESGVVMLMTQSAVRTLVTSDESDAVRTLDILNRTLYRNIERMGSDKNLSLTLLDYAPGAPVGEPEESAAGHVRVSGQHEYVIVVRAGGQVQLFDTVDLGLPIGLVDDVSPFVGEMTIPLQAGDTVVLYTDGITEAADSAHKLYGLERLCEVVSAHWQDSAAAIKDAVVEDVKRHIGDQPLYDDLTLIVVKQADPQRAYLA
ncbi:MAG: PP2C family protein-serine/threonine phosphatase [Actinomycetota bacterium]